jgi:hypothetical protein
VKKKYIKKIDGESKTVFRAKHQIKKRQAPPPGKKIKLFKLG